MEKIKCWYKHQYKDILIEVRQIGLDKVSLYINDVERDYFHIMSFENELMLKCQLDAKTLITIIYKPKFLRNTITVFVNRTQIDYVKKVKPLKNSSNS